MLICAAAALSNADAVIRASGIGAIGAIVGGLGVAVLVDQRGRSERERVRQEPNVYQALPIFGGKTQNRSVGIALVEGYWETEPHLRPVLVPLMIGQAIHRLLRSKESDDLLERANLTGIMELLERAEAEDRYRGTSLVGLLVPEPVPIRVVRVRNLRAVQIPVNGEARRISRLAPRPGGTTATT